MSRIRLSSKAKRVNEGWPISYESGEKIGELTPYPLSQHFTGHICRPTINRGNSTQIYTFVNGRPIKDNLLIGAIRYAYQDFIPSSRYPFAVLHLEIPYDQVNVNVQPNKSEVRFQNKRLIYEIVRKGIIKALSTRFAASGVEFQSIEEELTFDDSKSQEQVNNEEKKSQKEFYKKRPSLLENRLIKEFNAPDERKRGSSSRICTLSGLQYLHYC